MSPVLSGRRILIVEDEAIIAEFLTIIIEDEGGVVVGPASSVAQARGYIENGMVTAAILDFNLRDGEVTPLVAALVERSIPFLLQTGGILPRRVKDVIGDMPVLQKPAPYGDLVDTLRRIIVDAEEGGLATVSRGHVLVVEDSLATAALVEAYLERLGFKSIDRATTEAEAVAAAVRRKPDLMMVDIRLAQGDGISVVARIADRLGSIPAVFMTSYPELLGIDDHKRLLRKPFTAASMSMLIDKVQAPRLPKN